MINPNNPQGYVNSGLADLFSELVDDDPTKLPDTFFNARDPNLKVMHEKPEHRLLLCMKARGMSNNEIAAASGYTVPWISQLMRQPWARMRLAAMINEAGKSELDTILEGAAADSVYTLIEIRDDAQQLGSVRVSASKELLDRFLGKPQQQIKVEQTTKPAETIEQVDKELEQLNAEANRLLGKV